MRILALFSGIFFTTLLFADCRSLFEKMISTEKVMEASRPNHHFAMVKNFAKELKSKISATKNLDQIASIFEESHVAINEDDLFFGDQLKEKALNYLAFEGEELLAQQKGGIILSIEILEIKKSIAHHQLDDSSENLLLNSFRSELIHQMTYNENGTSLLTMVEKSCSTLITHNKELLQTPELFAKLVIDLTEEIRQASREFEGDRLGGKDPLIPFQYLFKMASMIMDRRVAIPNDGRIKGKIIAELTDYYLELSGLSEKPAYLLPLIRRIVTGKP